jgi:hypothetical protein
MEKAFQDHYPEEYRKCYGCGPDNEHGLQIKSYWDGDESVAVFSSKRVSHCISGVCLWGAYCIPY